MKIFFHCSNVFTGLASVLASYKVITALSASTVASLAPNGEAAWRSGGVHYRLCGVLTFNFALHFLRSYTPACAKPLVELNLPVAAFHKYLSFLQI